jgi:hypothetical protein
MAAQHENLDTTQAETTAPARKKRYARIAPLYKAMIWTSFILNMILFIVAGVLIGLLITQGRQFDRAAGGIQAFAGNNVAELEDVIDKLQNATIVYTAPLETRLPITIDVPIKQSTVVTLTDTVNLSVPAGILFPGGGGNLNATVNIQLPIGLQLPIDLDTTVPLNTSVPVVLDVPVNIPLAETELGPQFERLGAIVDRLVAPAEPFLQRPDVPPDSSSGTNAQPEPIVPNVTPTDAATTTP